MTATLRLLYADTQWFPNSGYYIIEKVLIANTGMTLFLSEQFKTSYVISVDLTQLTIALKRYKCNLIEGQTLKIQQLVPILMELKYLVVGRLLWFKVVSVNDANTSVTSTGQPSTFYTLV